MKKVNPEETVTDPVSLNIHKAHHAVPAATLRPAPQTNLCALRTFSHEASNIAS